MLSGHECWMYALPSIKRQLNIARGIGLYGKASFQSLSFTNHLCTKFYRYSASISSCCRHCFAVFRFVNCILYCSKSKLEPCYTFMGCSNDNALLNESSSSLVLSSHQSVSYFGTLANATCVWSWHQMHFHLVCKLHHFLRSSSRWSHELSLGQKPQQSQGRST